MGKVSVIIVTYNSTRDIKGCLNSLYKYNDIGEFLEVIIVDNNSDDIITLKTILTNEYPDVMLIENHQNGGYGQGNNIGIKNASSPVILIMNPDVRLYSPVFKKALGEFEQNSKLALLGMTQYESPNVRGNSFLPLKYTVFNYFRYLIYKMKDKYNPKYLFVSGACFFLEKQKFTNVGLFDEKIFMYGEEFDINHRIRNAGYKIDYDNTIGYIHPVHQRSFSQKSAENSFASYLYTHSKHKVNIKWEILNNIIILYIHIIRCRLCNKKKELEMFYETLNFYKKIKL